MSDYHVAAEETNTQRKVRLRFLVLEANVPSIPVITDMDKEDGQKKVKEWPRTALNKAELRKLDSAYVILIPLFDIDARSFLGGLHRTTPTGDLVRVDSVDQPVPAYGSGSDALLDPSQKYWCFWAYDAEITRVVWDAVMLADSVHAMIGVMRSNGFWTLIPQPINPGVDTYKTIAGKIWSESRAPDREINFWAKSWRRLNLLLHNIDPRGSHCYLGASLKAAGFSQYNADLEDGASYLIARRPAFDAMSVYRVMLGTLTSYRLVWMQRLAIFQMVMNINETAVDEDRVMNSALLKRIREQFGTTDHKVEYCHYAVRCAQLRIDRGLVQASLKVLQINWDEWFAAAVAVYEASHHEIIHPSLDPKDPKTHNPALLRTVNWPNVLAVFDYCRFGMNNGPQALWRLQYAIAESKIASATQRAINSMEQFLDDRFRWTSLVADLGARFSGARSHGATITLIHSYMLQLLLEIGYPWWKKLNPSNESHVLLQHLSWLATDMDKGNVLLGELFNRQGHKLATSIAQRAKTVEAARKEFEELFAKVSDLQEQFGGPMKSVLTKDHAMRVSLGSDARFGVVEVFDKSAARPVAAGAPPGTRVSNALQGESVGELVFVADVDTYKRLTMSGEPYPKPPYEKLSVVPAPDGPIIAPDGKTRLKVVGGKPKAKIVPAQATLSVLPALKESHDLQLLGRTTLPVYASALGSFVSLVLTLLSLSETTDSGITIFGKVTRDGAQTIDGVVSAINVARGGKWAQQHLPNFSVAAKTTGVVFEAIMNLHDGMVLLFSDDGDTRKAQREGRDGDALILETRGFVLVGSVVLAGEQAAVAWGAATAAALEAGATASLWGTALAAAVESAGISLAAAAVITVFIDVWLYLRSDTTDAMEWLQNLLVDASAREFGVDITTGESVADEPHTEWSRTADALDALSSHIDAIRGAFRA